MSNKLIVAHGNGQEIIGELLDDSSTDLHMCNIFEIKREHISVGETIGTMIILDPLSDDNGRKPLKLELCLLVREATKDEAKSYERVREQMSSIAKPSQEDIRRIVTK